MSAPKKGRVAIVVALLFLLCALAFFALAQAGVLDGLLRRIKQIPDKVTVLVEPEPQDIEPLSIDDYSWEELSELSAQIAAAATPDEAIALAAQAHLINEDGTLTGDVKRIELSDGTIAGFMICDLWHDDKSDGSGKTGLTLMSDSAIALRSMNSNGQIEGGWESSEMRAWLQNEGLALLPEDLSSKIVAVNKLTNNKGHGATAESVTVTSDKLWLFSAAEVCGALNWFGEEYGAQFAFFDDVANREGFQYRYFAEQGVASKHDPAAVLVRRYHGQKVSWWYRTPFPVGLEQYAIGGDFFYDVVETGYPYGQGHPAEVQGVVVGFCL